MEKNRNSIGKIKRVFNHPISKIIQGILVCVLVPILIKIAILKPIFGLFELPEVLSKNIQAIFTIVVILFTYKIFFKFSERRIVNELSINYFLKDTLKGLFIGFIIISFVTALFYLIGFYKPLSTGHISILSNAFIIFSLVGILEEIVFRGIIYRITEKRLGTVRALIISSLIFGFVHMTNANFNLFSGLAIALELGLLTGIFFTFTQRLWLSIALHIGWNFSFIFWGTIVSGATEFPNFINSTLVGPELITGGKFGPENSIITILFSLILFIVVFSQTSKRGLIIKKVQRKSIDVGSNRV